MSLILAFRGRGELTAQQNLKIFIAHARKSTPFVGVDWKSDAWDITAHIDRRTRGRASSWAYFSSWRDDTGNRQMKQDPLVEPFKSFAKAAFSEGCRRFRTRDYSRWIVALRAIEQALVELGGRACISRVNGSVLDRAVELLQERLAHPWKPARYLENMAKKIIDPALLTSHPLFWKSPVRWRPPTRNDAVNTTNRADSRLPDPRALLALGEIHASSASITDRVVTSYCSLALLAPSRCSEVLSLPVRCRTTAQDGDVERVGLTWRPAKGGIPLTKFATGDAAAELVTDTVKFLRDLGRPARVAAKWYAENPEDLYLPPGLEALRGRALGVSEIAPILGRGPIEATDVTYCRWKVVQHRRGGMLYDFASVERWVLKHLGQAFPILDSDSGLMWHEALFVLPMNVLRGRAEMLHHVPCPVSLSMINHQLGRNPNGITVFSRNGKVDDSGKPWKILTGHFRHFLNTLAQSKYISQELIAFWSGRKRVEQNAWYDHIPQEAFIEAYRKLDGAVPKPNVVGSLAKKVESTAREVPMSYDEALKIELGSIHVTRYGLCRHDYALTPCPKDKDCITCGEHLFAKGDAAHLKEAHAQRDLHAGAIQACELAEQRGEAGAAVWMRRHGERYERWRLAVNTLEDPSIPDGSLITLPAPTHSQTRSGQAIAANPGDNH